MPCFAATLVFLALVASAAAQGAFIALMGQDLHTGFDIKGADGKPWTKVCGGESKVAEACIQTAGCEAFTFGGEGDCGYLKSSGNQPVRYLGGLVPTNGKWSTFILPRYAPLPGAAAGGGRRPGPKDRPAAAVALPAAPVRPGFCQVKSGPLCCWTGSSKYNTCGSVPLKAWPWWEAKFYGVKDWAEYMGKQCGMSQSDRSFATKVNCCKESFGSCSLGPSARTCWVPVGRSNRCVETKNLDDCRLPIIQGYYTEEECLAF